MSFNKLILSIALGLSFHNVTMNMENEVELKEQLKTSAVDLPYRIYYFDDERFNELYTINELHLLPNIQKNITPQISEENTEIKNSTCITLIDEINEQIEVINHFAEPLLFNEAEKIEPTMIWLIQKRNSIHNNDVWNTLIDKLTKKISSSKSTWKWEILYKKEINIFIKKEFLDLKPNEGNPKVLAKKIEKSVYEVAQKYQHSFNEDDPLSYTVAH